MNNKSKQKNKSLQKGLFFAISSELEKAIGRRADWAAGAEIDDSDSEDQAKAKRKKYADRFGSGEVSDKEFEEDEKKPVQYRPSADADAQDVRTKDQRDRERDSAKLFREQTYGTKGKEPQRTSELQEVRDKFRESKNLGTKEGRDKLTADDKKEYAAQVKELYTPEKKKKRADESAEDRVWRNIRGGMTADSFTDPEDKAAYNRLSEKFRDSNAGKSAKAAAERRGKEGLDTIENSAHPDPARASSVRRGIFRDDGGTEAFQPEVYESADRTPADRTPADRTPAGPTPAGPTAADTVAKEAFKARRGRARGPALDGDAIARESRRARVGKKEGERRARIVTDARAAARAAEAERVGSAADEAARRARPISPSSGADLGADAETMAHVRDRLAESRRRLETGTPPRPRHDSSSAENFGQGAGAAIGSHLGGPVGGWLGGHLGKLAGRATSRGVAVLRGERGLLRNSLRNVERDANRLSKAVNKSFKKKH